jgi:hypothetical protein
MTGKKFAAMAVWCFSIAVAVLLLLLVGCSDNDGVISGSGDVQKSDRPRSGGPAKKAEMPNQDDSGTVDTARPSSGCSTYTSYGTRNGGRQAWRIPKKGPEFGSRVKVIFSNGHTVIVPNTSRNYRESDGFVFKPGIGPNGEGADNTGTAHGGVYLHAPYGNNSRMAELCGM